MSPSLDRLLSDFADGMRQIERRRHTMDSLASDIAVEGMGLHHLPPDVDAVSVMSWDDHLADKIGNVVKTMDSIIGLMNAELDRVRQARKEQGQ